MFPDLFFIWKINKFFTKVDHSILSTIAFRTSLYFNTIVQYNQFTFTAQISCRFFYQLLGLNDISIFEKGGHSKPVSKSLMDLSDRISY